jgi:hypothetical protein
LLSPRADDICGCDPRDALAASPGVTIQLSFPPAMAGRVTAPCRKDHVPDVTNDLMRRRVAEPSVVDNAKGHTSRPRPSTDLRCRMFMHHVHMKVPVVSHLEHDDLAVVGQWTICLEASDGRFYGSHMSRPRLRKKRVCRQDHDGTIVVGVFRPLPRDVVERCDARFSKHCCTPCPLVSAFGASANLP